MSRERCLFCDRFIFDGEDITRPAALGLTVHRQCYLRDAGLQSNDQSERRAEDSANDTTESDDW